MASGLTDAYRKLLLSGIVYHNYYIALYTGAVPTPGSDTVYTTTNEAVGTGYAAGGLSVSGVTESLIGSIAVQDFPDTTFSSVTLTAVTYARIYVWDLGSGIKTTVMIVDFGGAKSTAGGNFVLDFPVSGAATSTIQIA